MRFLVLFAVLGCRQKTLPPPPAEQGLDTAVSEQTMTEMPEPHLVLGLVNELVLGRVSKGMVSGVLLNDVVEIYAGRGEPSLGECQNDLCLDLADGQMIAQGKDTTLDFVYRVPTDDANVPFLLQAVVWQPHRGLPYKSNLLQTLADYPSWVAVAAGPQHTCAIEADGSGNCWGDSPLTGPWTNAMPERSDYLSLSSSGNHTVSLVKNSEVISWGDNGYGQAKNGGGEFQQVCGGGFHSCGLWLDGSVTCWGLNNDQQCNVPGELVATDISCGLVHNCALDATGQASCWGASAHGESEAPSDETFSDIASGDSFSCGVQTAGTLNCWGTESYGEQQFPSGVFSDVATDNHSACAIELGGDARCWGDNSFGQAPDRVPGPFVQLDVGGQHACGVLADGRLTCWGDDTYHQVSAPPARPQ